MKQLLYRYREIASELVAIGASAAESQALAAVLSVSESDHDASDGFSQLQDIKSTGEIYTYRGTMIGVEGLEVGRTSKGGEQLTITLSCRRSNELAKARFKGDQAFRIVSILALKFRLFEEDARGGFDLLEIGDQETIIEKELASMAHKIIKPSSAPVELNRSLRKKAMEVLGLGDFLITRGTRYRIELGPGAFAFDEASRQFFNELTGGGLDQFFKRYNLPMRERP